MDKKIIFVHGYRSINSSLKKDWYPLIAKELDKLGVEYSIPKFPGGILPKIEQWLLIIDKEVQSSKKPIVLVGHCLGTRAILVYLDKFKLKVDTIILISTFSNEISRHKRMWLGNFSNFFQYHVDTNKIQGLVKKIIIMHSKDDYRISIKEAAELAGVLNAKLITYKNKRHFNKKENYKNVLQVLKKEVI